MTSGFPSQRASNAESIQRYYVIICRKRYNLALYLWHTYTGSQLFVHGILSTEQHSGLRVSKRYHIGPHNNRNYNICTVLTVFFKSFNASVLWYGVVRPSVNILLSNLVTTYCRADSRFAPTQWETSLQRNTVSYWLGANLESVLYCIKFNFTDIMQLLCLVHSTGNGNCSLNTHLTTRLLIFAWWWDYLLRSSPWSLKLWCTICSSCAFNIIPGFDDIWCTFCSSCAFNIIPRFYDIMNILL